MTGIFDGHNIEDRSTPLIKLTDDVVTEVNCEIRRGEINDRIDDLEQTIANDYVTLATDQTITGQKTFTNSVFVNSQNFQTQDQFIRINQGAVNIGPFDAGVEIWNPNRPITGQPSGSWMRVLYSSTLNRYALYLEDGPGAFAYSQGFAYLSDIAAALNNYYTIEQINELLDGINDSITNILNNYYTMQQIDDFFSNYYTMQQIDNFFSNFAPGGGGGGGGGIFAMGEGSFRSGNINNTKTTVTLIPAAPSNDYYVSITPDEDTLAEVGEFWVDTANQSENGFDVYNTGLGITGFKWAVTLRSNPTIGGIIKSGTWNFAGSPNHVISVPIGMTMPDENYSVSITPKGDASTKAYVGEYWLGVKSLTSFEIYNSGDGKSAFEWQVSIADGLNLNMQAGGDLVGTFPNPTVAKIQGIPVSTTDPTDGQVLKYVASTGLWTPMEDLSGGTTTAPDGQEVFAIPGTYTFDRPAGHTSFKVLVIGSGGAGGAMQSVYESAGGGGGGMAKHNNLLLENTSYTVTIGDTGGITSLKDLANNLIIYAGGGGTGVTSGIVGGAGGSGHGGETNISGGPGGSEGNPGGSSVTGGGAAGGRPGYAAYSGGSGSVGGGGGGGGAYGNDAAGGGGGAAGSFGGIGGAGGISGASSGSNGGTSPVGGAGGHGGPSGGTYGGGGGGGGGACGGGGGGGGKYNGGGSTGGYPGDGGNGLVVIRWGSTQPNF